MQFFIKWVNSVVFRLQSTLCHSYQLSHSDQASLTIFLFLERGRERGYIFSLTVTLNTNVLPSVACLLAKSGEKRGGRGEGATHFYNFLLSPKGPNEWRNISFCFCFKVHQGLRPFECSMCQRKFSSKQCIERHVNLEHHKVR